jgi:hypothetical protein
VILSPRCFSIPHVSNIQKDSRRGMRRQRCTSWSGSAGPSKTAPAIPWMLAPEKTSAEFTIPSHLPAPLLAPWDFTARQRGGVDQRPDE